MKLKAKLKTKLLVKGKAVKKHRFIILFCVLALLLGLAILALVMNVKAEKDREKHELRVADSSGIERLEEIQLTGKLIVATTEDYPPYEYPDEESEWGVAGADIDLAEHIAESLGVELELYVTDFDECLELVSEGKVDIAIAAITPTEERMLSMDFSSCYFETYQIGLMTLDTAYAEENGIVIAAAEETSEADASETAEADNDSTDSTEENDLLLSNSEYLEAINRESIRIGALKDTSQLRYATELIPYATHIELDKISTGIDMLKSGELDFIAVELPTGESYIARTQGVVMTDYLLDVPTSQAAVAIAPGQSLLSEQINAIIEEVLQNDLYNEWLSAHRTAVIEGGI